MKQFISILSLLILTSCNDSSSNNNSESIYVDTSYTVSVDTTPVLEKNLEEEVIKVDSAKNYYHEPTEEERSKQEKVYEEFFGPRFYKIGAKSSVVIKVEGQPSRVSVAGPYKTFYYGRNSVTFYNGRLQEYDNADGNLKIKIDE